LRAAAEMLDWAANHARPSGMLPEQLDPLGRGSVSVCPLSWSHAEFVIAVLDYVEWRRELASTPE
jgi:GH15 family glucan-1,4-alpha-glucosidase